ncbi:adenylate/guanylate cyclase domain-containing protein [Ferrigenium kumadai]|uniref:Adenylate/guanylate cyclase domain-containing protein n=1 Tax=Ferrigenium kumadai TaxID=1682490 RepID=A0AAN1T079_9PROT|nr:CHASE2 domain-containing protein [Ferrigenium kumadai]BBJ00043.1 adenylate/guanylate cyclase domain-containing protein [Ferrigenium kumadai]
MIGLGLLIVLVFVGNAARFYQLGFVDQLSSILYDYRLRLTMPRTVDERIVILDIDEKSLKEEGRWPWSRDRLALLMDKLFDKYGIAIVGFDVVFAEKDESSGLKVLQDLGRNQLRDVPQFQSTLEQIRPKLDYDSLFASKIKNRNVVLGYFFTNSAKGSGKNVSGALPEPVFPSGTFNGRPINFMTFDSYGGNLPGLQKNAVSAGHFTQAPDSDGVVRRVPMIVEYNGAYYESLSLAMARTLLGQPKLLPGFAEGGDNGYVGLEWLELDAAGGKLKIPVDSAVATFVPYRGGQGSFRYISVADVLHDRVPLDELKDKIVLVGTSAQGLLDLRATPVAAVYPGVEVHANMISGILDQNLKERPAYMAGAEVLWLLLIGISLSFLLPQLGPGKAMLVSLFMFAVTQGVSLALWQYGNVLMPIANSLVMIALLFALDMSYGYFVESRTKRQITGLFGQYVPSELVEEMAEHPESVSMEGDSREMTILFSDVRGFTTISEGLDAKELTLLMNEFLTPLSRVVYKHRGTIDKYMGDCIMAFWGAPLPDPEHAKHAILAGIEMQKTLHDLQPYFKERGWPEIHIGVGINTGRVSVGNMGSEVRVAYTVMGDAVNLASRLEGITKQYGVGVVVGEHTREAVPDFVYRELDHVRVKGKDKPVAIFEPIGLNGEVDRDVLEEIKMFHQALKMYRKQDWEEAELQLYNLQRIYPQCKLYQVYAERVAYFRKNPPAADWDGVFVFETK